MPVSVTVRGEEVEVPCVHPAQLPGSIPPWQPVPEPHDENKHAERGRVLYGETWLRRRSAAIENRNFYLYEPDRQYREEQKWLRSLEETVEGRRFQGGLEGMAWAEYWAMISYETKLVLEQDCQMPGSGQDDEGDVESEYDSDIPDPSGDMRRVQLKRDRVRDGWDLETYHYHVLRLENRLIAERRNKYEDAIGDEQLRKELDELRAVFVTINSPGFLQSPDHVKSKAIDLYHRKRYYLERLRRGEPRDVVLAEQRREEEQDEQASPSSSTDNDRTIQDDGKYKTCLTCIDLQPCMRTPSQLFKPTVLGSGPSQPGCCLIPW
ncbi:hypothetical protein F503_01645 [Ophiostoma piceae UAMH 11346]|uniref:Uncharacterized protein n=1 Tax=Ophiostoma piceae (strain UAMH 11346) TaxID=1262450 RepID=S3BNU4_OPHP1|nr:hypothetical protein F503_01645 [Ophiostoma piceae UAMH 11346]